jgi:hypothetical protein
VGVLRVLLSVALLEKAGQTVSTDSQITFVPLGPVGMGKFRKLDIADRSGHNVAGPGVLDSALATVEDRFSHSQASA